MTIQKLSRALMLAALLTASLAAPALAQAPAKINYQGRLTDASGEAGGGTTIPDGPYAVEFRIWNDPSATGAANLIWGQKYNVTVVGGAFNILLGGAGGTPLTTSPSSPATTDLSQAFNDSNRYLELRPTAGPPTFSVPTGPIAPRQLMASVPYAMNGGASTQFRPGTYALAAGLTEASALNRIVEFIPTTNTIKLALDIPGQEALRIRGVYRGSGLIQNGGTASYAPGALVSGQLCYLSDSTPGTVTQTAPTNRPIGTLIGVASGAGSIALDIRPLLLGDFYLTQTDLDQQLLNPNFAAGVQSWIGQPHRHLGEPLCGQWPQHHVLLTGESNYQDIAIKPYIQGMVDNNGLRVRFGEKGATQADPKGAMTLNFLDAGGQPIVQKPVSALPLTVECGTQEKTTCVPAGTRTIRVTLSGNWRFAEVWVYFSYAEIDACPD